jgi:hypothetical protein
MIFNNFPDINASVTPPSNYRRGSEVKRYVEHYAKSQQLRQHEALQVQGSDLIIWNRIYTPRFCTCQGLDSSIHNNPAVTEDIRPQVVEAAAKRSIETLNKNTVQTAFKTKQQLNNILQEASLSDLSSLVDSLYTEDNTVESTSNLNQNKDSIKQNSLLEEAFLHQKNNLGIEQSEYVNCPICFSTRHTDTYQPHRGLRLVLDASDYYPVSLQNVQIAKDEFPFRFKFIDDQTGSITWRVTLPKYFTAISVKAYNMDHEATSVNLSYATNGSNSYSALNVASLQARSGSSNLLDIKCSLNANNITTNLQRLQVTITHVEIVLLYTDVFDKGELPMLTIPEQIDYQELYLRSRIVLSPEVKSLNRGDLICENKYGLLWQVIDVEKLYTSEGRLLNLRAEIRLVQNSEKFYNLSLFKRKLNTVKPDLYTA